MCSITVLIIWFFVVPGNMPVTAKICLEILFNCQLLCLLISILMLPEHISDISQMGKRKTVIQYKAEVPPGAPNWAPLCTCAHWATGTALPFWLKWTGSGGGRLFHRVLLFVLLCKLLWINSPISLSSARNNVESNQVRSGRREESRWWKLIFVPFL